MGFSSVSKSASGEICRRHGGPREADGSCWECDVERDVAEQEAEEAR